jgi:hypothetical protein
MSLNCDAKKEEEKKKNEKKTTIRNKFKNMHKAGQALNNLCSKNLILFCLLVFF